MNLTSPAAELQSYLGPGERLVWSGSPRGGIRFRGQDIFLIPFSLVWCGFAVFWTYTATAHGAPIFFTLWGMMFVCLGLFFVFGRFIADAKLRQNAVYGLTAERALILSGVFSKKLRSLNLQAIPEIGLTVHGDGTGTITFATVGYPGYAAPRGWPGSSRYAPPAFEFIDDPQQVHRLALAQQRPKAVQREQD